MKRALIALVAVGFVVAAISIARANSGDTPEARPAADESRIDRSREFDRDLTTEQVKRQSEQVLQAQEDIRKHVAETAEMAEGGSHTLVVTIREERPGDVWVAGKSACVSPSKEFPTFINVTAGVDGTYLVSKSVPVEATLLKSGACETTLELAVHPMDRYAITMSGSGNGGFDPVEVRSGGTPQRVTIVG